MLHATSLDTFSHSCIYCHVNMGDCRDKNEKDPNKTSYKIILIEASEDSDEVNEYKNKVVSSSLIR